MPVGADAAGGEQDVDAAAGAEVEHGLARVQVGHRGRVAAAQRGEHGGVGQLVALAVVVEAGAEQRRLLVGDDAPSAQRAASRGAASLGFGGAGGRGVALADGLADVGVGQLSHAVSSSRASGRT